MTPKFKAIAEDAQLQEAPAKFALGFKITLSLDENKITHALSWSNKTTLTVETEIPDPDQMRLKGMEEE